MLFGGWRKSFYKDFSLSLLLSHLLDIVEKTKYYLIVVDCSFFPSLSGISHAPCLHSHAGTFACHFRRLLANGLGAEHPHHHHAHTTGGEGQGEIVCLYVLL